MREVSVGENLDQYKLIEVIARSGMASIFNAIDQIDGKTVAIKVPYMQFESDVVFYGRFQREEEVGRRLNHPVIVKVLNARKKKGLVHPNGAHRGGSAPRDKARQRPAAAKATRTLRAVGRNPRVHA